MQPWRRGRYRSGVRRYVIVAAAFALSACGGAQGKTCAAAPVHTGAPPRWTAAAWAGSPGFRVPYAVAGGDSAAAFFFARPLRAGHPTNPFNKVLWVVRAARNGKPLRIVARRGGQTVRITRRADAGPGEIYPSYVDLPSPGCWRLSLAWGRHRARIDVAVADGAERQAREAAAGG